MERERENFETPPIVHSLEEAREVIAAMAAVILRQREENAALKAWAEELQRRGDKDPMLSTMLNKEAVERRVSERIAEGKPFGLLVIDLDHFKLFNDAYGHPAGDDLLRALEESFQRMGDEVNQVALEPGRIGGDEFLVIITDFQAGRRRSLDPKKQMRSAQGMLRKISQQLAAADPRAQEVGVELSVGSAIFDPNNPVDARTLIEQADFAMYEEKRSRGATRSNDIS